MIMKSFLTKLKQRASKNIGKHGRVEANVSNMVNLMLYIIIGFIFLLIAVQLFASFIPNIETSLQEFGNESDNALISLMFGGDNPIMSLILGLVVMLVILVLLFKLAGINIGLGSIGRRR